MRVLFNRGESLVERIILKSIVSLDSKEDRDIIFNSPENEDKHKILDIKFSINGVKIDFEKVVNSFKESFDEMLKEIDKKSEKLNVLIKIKATELIEEKFSDIFENLESIKENIILKLNE